MDGGFDNSLNIWELSLFQTLMWQQSSQRELSRPFPTPPQPLRPHYHSPFGHDGHGDDDDDACIDDDGDDDKTLIYVHLSPTISGAIMSRFWLNFILFHLL